MKTKTNIARISILVITQLLTAFPVRSDDLAAPVTAPADFWILDQPGRIAHACGGKEPLVLCMQGRKVVIKWSQSDEGLTLSVPKERPCNYAYVYKIDIQK